MVTEDRVSSHVNNRALMFKTKRKIKSQTPPGNSWSYQKSSRTAKCFITSFPLEHHFCSYNLVRMSKLSGESQSVVLSVQFYN